MKKTSLAVAALLTSLSTAAIVPVAYAVDANNAQVTGKNCTGCNACSACKACKGCAATKSCGGCSGSSCGGCSGS